MPDGSRAKNVWVQTPDGKWYHMDRWYYADRMVLGSEWKMVLPEARWFYGNRVASHRTALLLSQSIRRYGCQWEDT